MIPITSIFLGKYNWVADLPETNELVLRRMRLYDRTATEIHRLYQLVKDQEKELLEQGVIIEEMVKVAWTAEEIDAARQEGESL